MLNQATLTADIIKQLSVNAVNATQPFAFMYGTVTSVDPIEIEIDQKLKLGEKQLIFSTLVQDFDVDMYMEHEVEETDLIHKHDASIVITSPHGDTGTITVQNSPDSDKHIHEYKGVKTFTLNLKLAKDEKVLLLRIQGGQKFLVLDRVRVLNDTEFSSEFEGEGSTGSSGGSSSGGSSSGSSGSGNSGNTSGGTDSGNGNNGGGDNEGSTDNVNPDSGGSVGDVISVTALMTALLALTPEQKQELGLTGVKIDDENVSSETTYSSEKIQNAISSNSFDIANLEETTQLSNECCLPILQGEETKKVKVETLQSELNSNLENTINETVISEVSKIVADAPEDFDTLKEMSDWITEHKDSASAMNTAILKNTNNIATETTQRKSADENLQSQIYNRLLNTWCYCYTLGFTPSQEVSILELWTALSSKLGNYGFVKISWSNANQFYVVDKKGTKLLLNGGQLFYSCSTPTNWSDFCALYTSVQDGKVYLIRANISADYPTLTIDDISSL